MRNLLFVVLISGGFLLSACQAPEPAIGIGGNEGSGGGPTEPGPSPTPGPGTGTPCAQATLTWVAPTQNVDGTPLTNLAGYRLYYGFGSRDYAVELSIDDAVATEYILNDLELGRRYYFAMRAVNAEGQISALSNEVFKDMIECVNVVAF